MNTKLELKEILEIYSGYLNFAANRKAELPFVTDSFQLELVKKQLTGFWRLEQQGISIENYSVGDLGSPFQILSRSGVLSAEELYSFRSFFLQIENYRSAFGGSGEYEVEELVLDLGGFKELAHSINTAIRPDFSIADEASSRLRRIRLELLEQSGNIDRAVRRAQDRYRHLLSEDTVSYRNGFSAIAVKSSHRGAIDGIVTATSNSGGTAYMVPKEVLEISSRIAELKEEETAELYRIRQELSSRLEQRLPELKKSYQIALVIDRRFAACRYGASYRGSVALIGERILLKDLGHPLIDQQIVVRNDVELGGREKKLLLISGPNAGGKTVLLKALALACILHQAGLLVPAAEAELPILNHIFFVGGDDQSVLDNLSTFSSHIASLQEAFGETDAETLLIVDEIGQGTSPLEGSALGSALFAEAAKLGCYLVITSHYEDLKDRALADPQILSAAMVFDEDNLAPTFKISYGKAGRSFGIAVARRLGLDPRLIARAEEYLAQERLDPAKSALDALNARLEEVEQLKAQLQEQKEELARLGAKRERAIEALSNEKRRLLEKSEELIEERAAERLQQIDEVWNRQRPITNFAEMSRLKGEVRRASQPAESASKPRQVGDFSVGAAVRLKLSGQRGVVTGRKGGLFLVAAEGITFTLGADQIEAVAEAAPARRARTAAIDMLMAPRAQTRSEVVLIGLRADEAKVKLENYLYSCLAARRKQARIVHGVGTGALQRMTHQVLDAFKEVDSYRFGGEGEGGVGCTVVYFK